MPLTKKWLELNHSCWKWRICYTSNITSIWIWFVTNLYQRYLPNNYLTLVSHSCQMWPIKCVLEYYNSRYGKYNSINNLFLKLLSLAQICINHTCRKWQILNILSLVVIYEKCSFLPQSAHFYHKWQMNSTKVQNLSAMVVHTVHKGCRYQEYTTHMKNMN